MILNDSEELPPGDDATDNSNNKTQKKNQARSTHNILSMLKVEARTSYCVFSLALLKTIAASSLGM